MPDHEETLNIVFPDYGAAGRERYLPGPIRQVHRHQSPIPKEDLVIKLHSVFGRIENGELYVIEEGDGWQPGENFPEEENAPR